MTAALRFREAGAGDAAALGALHVACWRETYAGLLPDAVLEALSAEGRAAMWKAALDDPAAAGGTAVFVAEKGGAMVGFGACGGQRDAALEAQGFDGEIGAVYVLRAHQEGGAGRMLMSLMARRLLDQGRGAASLWVLRGNRPARLFYERLGGAVIAEREDGPPGAARRELAYGWRDLSVLGRGGEGERPC